MEFVPIRRASQTTFASKCWKKSLLIEVIKTKKMTGLQWLNIVMKIAIKLVPPQSWKGTSYIVDNNDFWSLTILRH